MAYENNGISDSSYTLHIPPENSRGSNECIINEYEKKSTGDQLRQIGPWCRRKARNIFRKKILYKRVPILKWLPNYNKDDAVGDLVAGITVGLTVIPQALAYSNIAGLSPQYGLYSAFLGCFVYIFLGSCKDVPMGPSAISSLLTLQSAGGVWQKAVLLSFSSGVIALLMGLFQLGFLIDFVSGPVSSGFTSAVSLIILSSQIKDLLGIKTSGNTFLEMWTSIFKDIHNARLGDALLGFACIAVLLLMRLLVNIKIGPKDDHLKSTKHKLVNKILWLVGTARNAILVILTGVIAYFTFEAGNDYFKLIQDVPSGLPSFQAPEFSIPATVNETTGEIIEEQTFIDMISSLGSGLIVVPLLSLLEDIAICKAFANGKAVDATQELIAIGASNIVNSFAKGYPSTGALSRGAVNNASGVRTPLGGLYTGLLVILSLLFFTPLFFYIPKAALAGIIIAAVIFMIEVKVVKPMWRSKKSDILPGFATFFACLCLPLEYGIIIGIAINIVYILYHAARPKIRVEKLIASNGTKYLMITPDRCLIFPSVDYVRNLVNKEGLKSNAPVVLDCSHVYGADYTAAKVVESLMLDFGAREQPLLFYNLKRSVEFVFEGVDTEITVYYNLESLEKAITIIKT